MDEFIPKYDLVKTIDGINIYCLAENEMPNIDIKLIRQKLFNVESIKLEALPDRTVKNVTPFYNELNETLKIILNNKELLYIMGFTHPIELLFVGGSRMLNIAKSESDFDLNIVLNQTAFDAVLDIINKSPVPLIYFEHNAKKIHWYYSSDTQIIDTLDYYEYMKDFWIVEATYGLINPKNQLIVVDNFKFIKFYNTISQKATKEIIDIKQKYFDTLNRMLNLDLEQFAKEIYIEIYHLCIISCLINNLKLNKEYLIELKKYAKLNTRLFLGGSIEYNTQTIQWCNYCLTELLKYFNSN